MNGIAYDKILILLFQCLIVATLLLSLFRLRSVFGLSLLFTALGVFQFMQVFIYNSIYFKITSSILVSPGTIVFTGSLFAILLIYIREDALEARKVIYAILAANLILAFMQFVISWGIEGDGVLNVYNLPKKFFTQEIRAMIVGTFTLVIDAFIMIFIYETISRHVSSLFLRIFFSMAIVLSIDSLVFNLGILYGTDQFLNHLISHLTAKISSAFVYSILFTIYLTYFDKKSIKSESKSHAFNDIFSMLTYRQKYEQVFIEKKQLDEQFQEQEMLYQTMFEKARNVIYVISTEGKLTSINPAFEELTGWSVKEWIHQPFTKLVHPEDLHLAMHSFKNILEEKEVKPYELRILCKSGEYVIGEFTPALLKNKNNYIRVLGIAMDVTERINAKEKIIEERDKAKQYLDIAAVMLVSLDSSGIVQLINPKGCEILGYTEEEILGTNWFDNYLPKNQRKEIKLVSKKVFIGEIESVKQFENKILTKSGKERLIAWKNEIIKDHEGKLISVLSSGEDITQKRKAELELKESEERFRNIFDEGPFGIAMASFKDGYMLNVNKALCKMLGYTKEEMKLLTFKDVTHPDFLNTDLEAIKGLLEGTIQSHNTEKQYLKKNGEMIWAMRALSKISSSDAKSSYALAMIEDITERKLAEEALRISENHFRQLFEVNPQPMWIYDLENLQFKDVNHSALKKYGYSKEAFLSMTLKDIRPSEDVSLLLKNLEVSDNELQDSGVWRHQLKDGTIIYVEIFSHKLMFQMKPARLVLVNDITDRKKAELELTKYQEHLEEIIDERTEDLSKSKDALLNLVDDLNIQSKKLESSNKQLAQINEELETFTYSVSHDLKAPLRGIDGYSQLLLENYKENLNSEAQEFLMNIRNSTMQMNLLIEDLLAYSRMERLDFDMVNLYLNPIVENIIRQFSKVIHENKIQIEISFPEEFKLIADKEGLQLVLRNLIDNAIKFSKTNKKAKIEIGGYEGETFWHIFVKDNGIGFDMKYHDRIFKIFQRLHLAEEFEGTGIGLAMVLKAMYRMNGKVWAESKLNEGSCFHLEINKTK